MDPRLVFHHGVPSGTAKFAYDNIHNILALSTKYVTPYPCHFVYSPIVKFCDVVYTVTSKVFYWIYAWNRFLLGFFFTGMGGLNYLEKIIPKSYLNLVSQCLASFYRLCFSFPFPCQASVWINKLFKCLWHKDLTHKLFL